MELSAPQTPIAIIGMGALFPEADGLKPFWRNLRQGKDSIRDIPDSHWQVQDYYDTNPKAEDRTYGRKGGFLDAVSFDPMEFGVAPNTLEAIDTTQLLGLVVAKAALADAGLLERPFNREKASVILGVTGTLPLVIPLGARLGHPIWRKALADAGIPEDKATEIVARIAAGYVPWQEDSFPGLLGNVVAGRIANRFDLHGTNCVVDAACASSLSAIHLAMLELSAGKSDVVVSGGFDTFNDIFMYMCFSKTPALSPGGQARPFAANGDGTTLGEGLGCLVLKRLADAERDGDRIYAVIRGLGSSSDGKGQAIYSPSPEGQARAIQAAYRAAGIDPKSVGLVEAHGTGTKAGDLAELHGLLSVFQPAGVQARSIALGSVKSQIGHTKAAAGAAGLIKAALALHHKTIPPTLHAEEPLAPLAEASCPFYLPGNAHPWLRGDSPRRAGVSSFGFGGSNFHAVLEEYSPTRTEVDWDGKVEILAWSADSAETLQRAIEALPAEVSWTDLQTHAQLSREQFDSEGSLRLVVVAEEGQTSWSKLRARALSQLNEHPSASSWSLNEGIYFGRGAAPGSVALLFPGQGSQRVAALRELFLTFPEAMETLDAAQSQLPGIGELLFPTGCLTSEDAAAKLKPTEIAQPLLAAIEMAGLAVLQRFGVAYSATAGHSFGELSALAAAGRLQQSDLLAAAVKRGQCMAEAAKGQPGGMIAVATSANEMASFLGSQRLTCRIANINGPSQVVLAGTKEELVHAQEALRASGFGFRPLEVAAAFHTSAMGPAQVEFGQFLNSIKLTPSAVCTVSNTSGTAFPDSEDALRSLLVLQMVEPIRFDETVRQLYQLGCRTFIEVGPGNVLNRLAASILADRADVATFALDASTGRRNGLFDLARVLAQLAALGHKVDLTQWQRGAAKKPREKDHRLAVKLTGANFVRQDRQPNIPVKSADSAPHFKPPVTHEGVAHSMSASELSSPRPPAYGNSNPFEMLAQICQTQAEVHKELLRLQARTLETIQVLTGTSGAASLPSLTPAYEAPASNPLLRPSSNGHAHLEPSEVVPLGKVDPQTSDLRNRLSSLQPNGNAAIANSAVSVPTEPREALAPAPARHPAPPPPSERTLLVETLTRIVSQKTGYARELLEMDQELDADLGIDSIKRVEIFAALQEAIPNVPALGPEQAAKLRTLGAIVDFLNGNQKSENQNTPVHGGAGTDAAQLLRRTVAAKTGYPEEMLEPHLQLDADLGIDSIKRVEIFAALRESLPSAPVIEPEHVGRLRTLADVAAFLNSGLPAGAAEPHRNHAGSGRAEEVSATAFF